MATSLLHDILRPLDSDYPPDFAIMPVSPSPSESAMYPKALLQKKQERYDEHVAKSKSLFALWEAAKEKPEKSKIWALIKEENRCVALYVSYLLFGNGSRPNSITRFRRR